MSSGRRSSCSWRSGGGYAYRAVGNGLMPFAFGVKHFTTDMYAEPHPLRQEQDDLLPEDITGELVHPRLVGQRLLLAAFLLDGLVANQVERTVSGRRQCEEGGHDQFVERRRSVPIPGVDHPPHRPIAQ